MRTPGQGAFQAELEPCRAARPCTSQPGARRRFGKPCRTPPSRGQAA